MEREREKDKKRKRVELIGIFFRRSVSGVRFALKRAAPRFANVQLVRRNFNQFAETMASATGTSASFASRVVNIDERSECFIRDFAVSTDPHGNEDV